MNDKNTGIHRAKLWQIGCFAFNNSATNLYMFFMNFIAYYLTGMVGVGVVVASTVITTLRIWDGVTDPFIGYLIDNTSTKFGKNRPFMLIGNIILAVASYIMLHVTHLLPTGGRFIFFVIIYMIYIIGYTFQCVVTKSAQTCLTNDPKQRPLFTIFEGIYNTILFAAVPILVSSVLVPRAGGFNEQFFHEMWMIVAPISFVFTLIAIFAIAPKDRPEYFGMGKAEKVQLKDYWEVLKGNKAMQMLIVSASTDKLAMNTQTNSTVGIIIFGIVCGNYALSGAVSAYTSIPTMFILMFGAGYIATRMGQRQAMLFGTIGGLICSILMVVLFYIGDPTTLAFPGYDGFTGWNFFTLSFIVLYVLMKGFTGVSGNIVIPMTADCADYEVYRSGKYVPGLMGTLFSFVDKLISSLSATIVGMMCAFIGFSEQLPTVDTPYSDTLKFVGLFCMFGLPIFGLICNVIAMKFYPLTKEKMESIQEEIAATKARCMEEASA